MASERVVIPGIVTNGLVVPQNALPVSDGARVDILVGHSGWDPRTEIRLWNQGDNASEEAWSMIE